MCKQRTQTQKYVCMHHSVAFLICFRPLSGASKWSSCGRDQCSTAPRRSSEKKKKKKKAKKAKTESSGMLAGVESAKQMLGWKWVCRKRNPGSQGWHVDWYSNSNHILVIFYSFCSHIQQTSWIAPRTCWKSLLVIDFLVNHWTIFRTRVGYPRSPISVQQIRCQTKPTFLSRFSWQFQHIDSS